MLILRPKVAKRLSLLLTSKKLCCPSQPYFITESPHQFIQSNLLPAHPTAISPAYNVRSLLMTCVHTDPLSYPFIQPIISLRFIWNKAATTRSSQ